MWDFLKVMIPHVSHQRHLRPWLRLVILMLGVLMARLEVSTAEMIVARLDDDEAPGSLRSAILEANAAGTAVLRLDSLQGVIYLDSPCRR
jgi:hypothetical protein